MSYANEATPADLAALGKRGNKYGAKPAYYHGEWYHSTAEATYAAHLDMLRRVGEIDCWERQVPVVLHTGRGGKAQTYYVDFLVTYPDGSQQYHEVKSAYTATLPDWRKKKRHFENEYPDRVLRVVV